MGGFSIDPIPPDPLTQRGKGAKVPPCLGRDLGWGLKREDFRVGSFLSVLLVFAIVSVGFPEISCASGSDTVKEHVPDSWPWEILNIIHQKALAGTVVKVAVVDDGFRLSHKTLRNFIYTNEQEIPGNFQDDDHNGFVDDVHGWDISDNDNDVSVLRGKENTYYHGTYISGIIATIFQQCYGDEADKILRIIPVKVLSDQAPATYLADGYKGIKYASDLGADIICCAWSGGQSSEEEKAILDAAVSKGIIIIGSSGNLFSEKAEPPSSFPGVFCVAAVDPLLKKSKYSNYGMRTDIVAPGDSVYGPHPLADNAFIYDNGTSPAAAIVAGCAAILKALDPKASAENIFDAIRNTASPVDSLNLSFCGKLGSGIPDMGKAIAYLKNPEFKYSAFSSSRPKGKIFFRKNKSPDSWEIHPPGAYKVMHITSVCHDPKKIIKLYTGDSLWYDGPIEGISKWMFIPGSRFKIELQPRSGLPKEAWLSYYMETIDSTTLYCRGTQYLEQDSGVIEDGSVDAGYANNCSCKWQITVPANKRIRIEFLTMDTQPNVDFVWLFDGTSALEENLLAKFSGTSKPPVITSLTNKILVWFITDGQRTGKGWEMQYSAVDQ